MSSTQDIVSSLGGVFSNFFVDEKGVGALIIFGANYLNLWSETRKGRQGVARTR